MCTKLLETIRFEVDNPGRIDKVIQGNFPDYTRSFLQGLLENGHVVCNGKQVTKKSYKVKSSDVILVEIPEPEAIVTPAEDIPLKIVYQDADIAVINKPFDMLTHPLHPGQGGTLVNALLFHLKDLSGINGKLRPGIVHRLDRNTSGLIIVAKNDQAHQSLQEQFASRTVKKVYYALVYGALTQKRGEIAAPLGRDPKRRNLRCITPEGKNARTLYRVIKSWDKFHLVRVRILTGRTHQIRVHLKSIKVPIIGDGDYQGRLLPKWVKRTQLHSFSVTIDHPRTGERMCFKDSLALDMLSCIEKLNNGDRYVS
jgi:23S rRNA pseudouridine1911/1915/1917 synthase